MMRDECSIAKKVIATRKAQIAPPDYDGKDLQSKFDAAFSNANFQLGRISELLAELKAGQKSHPKDWGFLGSVQEVNTQLADIRMFLSDHTL